jgi:hypothetical protein
MRRRVRRALVVLVVLAAAGWAARAWFAASPAPAYTGTVASPTWRSNGPPVLIDTAHWSDATADGRLRGFAGLLAADGYRVLPGANATRAETLADARIGVVVNPLGVIGVARRAASRIGIGGWAAFDDDALMLQEIETTVQWIENGGSMLIAADPDPDARGLRGLTAALGVHMQERLTVDVGHSESREPSWLVFSRENDLVGTHPIVDGFPDAPPVNRVVAFGGQALQPPDGAAVLLRLSPSAADVDRAGDPPTTGRSVAGLAMAVAFERGRGRVVVLGDSDLLTIGTQPAGPPVGLAWPGTNNERFVRYILRWLSRKDAA